MHEVDYDQLFRLLCKLQTEAPCHNGGCVGTQVCDYGISNSYGNECAIEILREVIRKEYECKYER